MTLESIQKGLRDKVGDKISLASEGKNRYRVFTPFLFNDGDHLAIVLKRERENWVFSDEGHTLMHLSYDIETNALQKGNRNRIIINTLGYFDVEDRDGELVVPVNGQEFGDALFSYIQALLKITDLNFLSREIVRSTFIEDFKAVMSESVPHDRLSFDWHDPEKDPEGKYPVDCRINSMKQPLFILALPNNDRIRDATISLLNYEKWYSQFLSIGVFEDQEQVNRKVLARFSDVCGKLFSSLTGNKDRISKYLNEII